MAKHNKKRNVGLIYEFLVRYVAECLVEGNDRGSKKAVKLLKKHILKKGTELHREFRLFLALANTTVESEGTAALILQEAKAACKQYNAQKLDREKSLLIRGINHTLNDPTFYSKHLDEYRIYATIQTLLNEWRQKCPTDITKLINYEKEMIKWLMTNKQKNVLAETPEGVDDLLVSLMIKKVNKRYEGVLTPTQVNLIKVYVEAERTGQRDKLIETINELKVSSLKAVDTYIKENEDTGVRDNMNEVRMLISKDIEKIDDDVLTRFLRVAKLKEELQGE